MRQPTLFRLLVAVGLLFSFQLKETQVRIFMIGDSTMANKPLDENPERGWGQLFPTLFDSTVAIQNHAVNGRSTKSFRDEGRWDSVMVQLQPGDWVFIEFGHNDEKSQDPSRYASPKDYQKNLERFIKEAQAKGARPILLTPTVRRKFNANGQLEATHGDYPDAARKAAKKTKVPMIDMTVLTRELVSGLGDEASKRLYLWMPGGVYDRAPDGKQDDTHFSEYGALHMAGLVARELQKQGIPLAEHLKTTAFADLRAYELPLIDEPHFKKDTFDIRQYGAKPDGVTLNTDAINQAIAACSENGGGVVHIPAGLWLTGPLALKSHVNLYAAEGALVQFSDDPADYPLIETNWEGMDAIRNMSPIYGKGLEDVAVTGRGLFDGGGDAWRPVTKGKMTESQWTNLVASGGVVNEAGDTWYRSEQALRASKTTKPGVIAAGYTLENAQEVKDFLRPNMVSLIECKRVLLEGVTFQNSPAWCLHPLLSEHVTLRGLTVRNPWYGKNGDGVDLESTRYVLVEDCTFDVGDDGICLKSGRDEEGRKRGIPTENVIIRNSTVFHAHGGFVVGSEMSGGVRNIYASNCTFVGTDIGIRFKTTRGRGGVVDQVYLTDINMADILGEAILFNMYYAAQDPVALVGENRALPDMKPEPVNDGTPQFKDIFMQNVFCRSAAKAITMRGLAEMNIRNVRLENAVLRADEGATIAETDGLTLKNVQLVPLKEQTAFHIHNSRNLVLENVRVGGMAQRLLSVTGSRTGTIQVVDASGESPLQPNEYGEGVSADVVQSGR
ncbi:DNA sulfur modification protein DndE [Catalinimonas alkaloidigena]|uniref:DNA sulfur modification protein DndE n=1 Tax=Catalinimonas alkaloidigena TaxID=1075417 RepID=A0A1G9DIE3_9BACT|nr:glycosyl hydrolase family 28 protein [Catalinimonas alkaloidigena]SDK63657.1 DNA sulfur modification protein DndE [Catalinimonas alkaloidigena]